MKIEIIEKELGYVLEIEEKIKMFKMPSAMKANFKELYEYVTEKGCECENPPYARYVNINWEEEMTKSKLRVMFEIFTRNWHFMAGVPVPEDLKGQGRMKENVLPMRKYVTGIHKGPYHKVGHSYQKLGEWISKESISVGNESIEIYLNDPRVVSKENLETMLLIPVAD
ncbi:MAG: GyrI-like domain-containing protein [Desulfovibrio sp.]